MQTYRFNTNHRVLKVLKLTPRQGTPMRAQKRLPELGIRRGALHRFGYVRARLGLSLEARVGPIFLLRLSLLRFADSRFPGNSLWAWEFHPF